MKYKLLISLVAAMSLATTVANQDVQAAQWQKMKLLEMEPMR